MKSSSNSSSRDIHSNQLINKLIQSGRAMACEVAGCTCTAIEKLELHHIMPVSIKPVHADSNLVILCRSHHALIERYYWWQRSMLMPETARRIKTIARMFKARAVPVLELDMLKAETAELWKIFNNHKNLSSYLWWHAIYKKAKQWAVHQNIIREVDPKDAIVEEPWFRDIRASFDTKLELVAQIN